MIITPVSPTITIERTSVFRSPLRYPGGKQRAIAKISEMLPASVKEYREPMVGGGSVFFHARNIELAKHYWINDKFSELTIFWKIVQDQKTCHRMQHDLEALRKSFRSAKAIKAHYLKVREEQPRDPYRIALLFFFFNRVTFSGTTRAGGFSSAASLSRFTASSIDRLGILPDALSGVQITALDFEEVVSKPGDDVFLFLDPPYYTASKLYGHNGSLHEFDHERLAKILHKSKHRFLITYDDCNEIRQLYSWAKIKPWRLQYGMNNCNVENLSKVGQELFVLNYC